MIQNNVTFNSVKTGIKAFTAYPLVMKNQQGPDEDGMGIINAVDIDWNGAEFPNTSPLAPSTINTTGDLINAIKWASAQGGNNYILNPATDQSLGGIKIGFPLDNQNKDYPIQLSNEQAYVHIPWTDTTINADINTPNKKLTVLDSNNSEKFKIELTTDTNNSDVAVIKISSGNTNIQTAVPGITIDGRKLVWTNASGVASNNSITFGNLIIKDVFSEDSDPQTDDSVIGQVGNRYVAFVDLENTEQMDNSIKDQVNVGDLYLQQIQGVYYLFVCDEVAVDEEAETYEANAYFINLGAFPGNNITLSAENISLTDISSTATGVTTTDVQTALEHTLYYEVIDSILDTEEEDNTNTEP